MESISTQNLSENSFDFASLPYVCQRRFAEICDGKTLRTFASINASTRQFSKRCHWIKKVIIDQEPSIYARVQCYCTLGEFCKGLKDSELFENGTLEVLEEIEIQYSSEKSAIDASFFQQFPITFKSNEHLRIVVNSIKFSLLRSLINPNLKTMYFEGEISFDCTFSDFLAFLDSLTKQLDKYQ